MGYFPGYSPSVKFKANRYSMAKCVSSILTFLCCATVDSPFHPHNGRRHCIARSCTASPGLAVTQKFLMPVYRIHFVVLASIHPGSTKQTRAKLLTHFETINQGDTFVASFSGILPVLLPFFVRLHYQFQGSQVRHTSLDPTLDRL